MKQFSYSIFCFTPASDGLPCWLLEKTAKLGLTFCVWGVPAFCWKEIQDYRSRVHWDIWHQELEAVPLQRYLSVPRLWFEEETVTLRGRKLLLLETPSHFDIGGFQQPYRFWFFYTHICYIILLADSIVTG